VSLDAMFAAMIHARNPAQSAIEERRVLKHVAFNATLVVLALIACSPRNAAQANATSNSATSTLVSTMDSPATLQRVAWLKRHASPVRTVNPADEDFSDLIPLGRAIGNSRVVFLGESGHGEGSTTLGKTRLLKFLHQKLGFDVVVWESGLYEAPVVWSALQKGGDPVAALEFGMMSAWSWTGEIEPLARYLAAQSSGPRPMQYAGFDPQLTARGSVARRSTELAAVLDSLGLREAYASDSLLWRGLQWSFNSTDSLAADSMAVERFAAATASLGAAMVARANTMSSRFWRQVLEGAAANARGVRVAKLEIARKVTPGWGGSNPRDEQAGRNILWLLNDRYRGHKLIVWSATIHAARNVETVDTRDTLWNYKGYRTTGDYVWDAIGAQSYTIGFVGLTGSMQLGDESYPIKQHKHEGVELEQMLGVAGFETAFLDLRRVARGGEWLHEPMLSRQFAEHPKIARWNNVIDGVVFIRDMKPATWPNYEARMRARAGRLP
jgi:erythromycin esterase